LPVVGQLAVPEREQIQFIPALIFETADSMETVQMAGRAVEELCADVADGW
jgi:hypothetical protein